MIRGRERRRLRGVLRCAVASAVVLLIPTATIAAAQPPLPYQPAVQFEVGFQHEKAYDDKHFNGWAATVVVPSRVVVSPVVRVSGVYRSSLILDRDDRERLLSVAAGVRFQRWRSGVRPWVQVLVGVSDRFQTVTTTSGGTTTRTFDGTGVIADISAGLSGDITRLIGLSGSVGYTPRLEGYVFSGYRLSLGATMALGAR